MRRPSGKLWHHSDFLKLWTGQSISEFGSQVSGLAIPWLAAKELHASPLAFSLLGVLAFLPFILFALPAGVWVDRLRRRPILIVGDASRAVLLAWIPIAWALGILTMWQLFVIEFAVGIFTVFFDVAYQSYLPSLVDRDQLGRFPLARLVRAQADDPCRRAGERAIERLDLANMAAGESRIARSIKTVDPVLLDQRFEAFILRIDRADAPAVAALRLRPKLVALAKQPAGVECRNLNVDRVLGDQMENDLILQTEAGREHDPSVGLAPEPRQALGRR